jgi:hypothetical protein
MREREIFAVKTGAFLIVRKKLFNDLYHLLRGVDQAMAQLFAALRGLCKCADGTL